MRVEFVERKDLRGETIQRFEILLGQTTYVLNPRKGIELARAILDLAHENGLMPGRIESTPSALWFAQAILDVQWSGEAGHWEEEACPFCRASAYEYGEAHHSIECHRPDCIVRTASRITKINQAPGDDGEEVRRERT